MRSIFSALLAAAIIGAIGFSQPLAAAPVTPTFSVSPSSILAGDAATIDLSLLLLPDPGFSNAAFFSGSVDFDFGDGSAKKTVSITPGGTSNFDFLHTYIDLGSHTVSYSAVGIFLADFASESARAGCSRAAIARISNRFLRIHRRNFCRQHPTVSFVLRGLPTSWEVHGSDVLTVEALATPLPAALPLFASGAALLGWLARRRRNKASSGLSNS